MLKDKETKTSKCFEFLWNMTHLFRFLGIIEGAYPKKSKGGYLPFTINCNQREVTYRSQLIVIKRRLLTILN